MNRKATFVFVTLLTFTSFLPINAHAGFNGDTVSVVFQGPSSSPIDFGSQTVGSGVEFSGVWAFNSMLSQVWNITIDIFDTGVKLYWEEITHFNPDVPNGGNLATSAPDGFKFDLTFGPSSVPPLFLTSFNSSGYFSPHVSSLDTLSLTSPHSVHIGFIRFDSTDNYTLMTAIPEPATYAMLLTGLGLLGFIARGRKRTVV